MKFLTDENFEGAIFRGLLRHKPDIDLVRVQDVGLSEADDPTILEWASAEGRHHAAARHQQMDENNPRNPCNLCPIYTGEFF